MVKPLDVLDKIGNFIEKYTDSNYGYTEPSGEINDNYQQIGEIFGFPIWMDDGRRYENEFLDFPTLADILTSVANTKISFEVKKSDCSICLVINYSIPLITYPPIVLCLAKPDCKKEKESEEPKTCISEEEWMRLKDQYAGGWRPSIDDSGQNFSLPPVCQPEDFQPVPDDAMPPPGKSWLFEIRRGAWYVQYGRNYFLGGFGNTEIISSNPVDINNRHGLTFYMYWTVRSGETFAQSVARTYGGKPRGINESYSKVFNGLDDPLFYSASVTFKLTSIYYSWIPINLDGYNPPLPDSDPPIDPPIPDPTVDMNNNCCEDIKKILARIERQMKDVHRVLNPNSFKKKEVQMPKNWLYPGNEGKPVIMDDYADLIAGVGRLIDRRLGYLPQMVRIKDTDPTKEGDQEINLVVNSLADANRLILEYLLQTHGDVSGIQMMNVANLYESGAIHQIAVVIREELEAISAYLGYADGKRKEAFPMAFNPKIKISERNPESLDKLLTKFLTPTKQDVEVSTFNGKKTLVNQLNNIKRDTANSAAAVTRKLSDSSLEDLVEETQNIERLKRLLLIKEFQDREGIGDLGEFLKDAESAYPSTESPARRYDKPYGFQPTEKPKMQVTSKKSRKKKYKPDTNTK